MNIRCGSVQFHRPSGLPLDRRRGHAVVFAGFDQGGDAAPGGAASPWPAQSAFLRAIGRRRFVNPVGIDLGATIGESTARPTGQDIGQLFAQLGLAVTLQR